MVEHIAHFKGWGKWKESQGSIQGHHRYSRSVNLLLEPHRKMYSDIRQGEHETTDQLDQCIKDLVEWCQYQTEAEKMVHRTELLFHATKHFEVKKWVRSKKKREDVTYTALLQHAKEHRWWVKDFNWHKSNGGVATATTIDEIKTFQF